MSGLRTRSACIVLMLAAMAPLLAGCNEPMAAAAPAPAEPEVGTFTVRPQARAIIRELPGRIAPTRVSEVRARVSGIIVERLFRQGTEVTASDPLYRIDPKPFEVELQASEAAQDKAVAAFDLAAQHARRIATLTSQRAAPEAAKVRLVLDDGTVYPIPGKLLFSEAKVDAYTGQVTLRGQFPNPHRELLPGLYVRVLIEQGIDSDAIAVPQQAIQRDAGGGSEVFVVKEDGRVATQPVRTGAVQDGLWLVSEGLKDGDRVVVDGFQKFVPGDKVKAKAWIDADASVGSVSSTPATPASR